MDEVMKKRTRRRTKRACRHCGKRFFSKGLSIHERACRANPSRVQEKKVPANGLNFCPRCGAELHGYLKGG